MAYSFTLLRNKLVPCLLLMILIYHFFFLSNCCFSTVDYPCLLSDVLLFAAIKAVEVGVAGIVVSNHGARQLDYSPATITVLEEVTVY